MQQEQKTRSISHAEGEVQNENTGKVKINDIYFVITFMAPDIEIYIDWFCLSR